MGLQPMLDYKFVSKNQIEELDCGFEQSCVDELNHQPRDSRVGSIFQVQSDVSPLAMPSDVTATTNETVTFMDTTSGERGGYDAPTDVGSRADETLGIELKEFFARPVRIGTFTWNESDAVATSHTYNPWNLFFADSRVQYKLNNYAFIQCDLKVKILINSSPFYYGSMYCGYQPLPAFTPSTIITDASNRHLMLYSQRPCVWLTPQRNEGAEMTLPFLYPQNWLNAQSASDMTNMGQLTFLNYTALASANGVTGSGVTIAIYAWAENVRLSGPSVALATQSDTWEVQGKTDEYGKGPVSSVATAIAKTAGALKSIPIIGRFATATEIGASAVSSIAKLFGWTNVPVIADVMPFRNTPFPPMASTEIGYPIDKLTIDSKNELTVDPAAIGMKPDDELAVATLVQKDSFLTSTSWTTAQAVDTILFSSRVTPIMFDLNSGANTATSYYTPMAWVGALFANWRGDVIFKFRIVASQYHKGRLRISFDPSGTAGQNVISDATTSNVVFTQIVDLGEQEEVEFRIPYQQALPYLRTPKWSALTIPWSISASPTFAHSAIFDNGTITVRVQTALTAPVASSTVAIMVFVRGAENLEYANPRELPANKPTMFAVQADSNILGTAKPKDDETRHLVHFGERIVSLRPLLRRYSMVGLDYMGADVNSYIGVWQKAFSKIPPMYGFDVGGGINQAKGIVVPLSNFKFNFVQGHPITWLLPAFIGYRGSVNWSFNGSIVPSARHLRVVRTNDGTNVAARSMRQTATLGGGATVNSIAQTGLNTYPGLPGTALTNQHTNSGINVACPMQTRSRFQSTNPVNYTVPSTEDGSDLDMFTLEYASNTIAEPLTGGLIWSYAAIGTDFNMHFFLNVPSWITYTAAVVPV